MYLRIPNIYQTQSIKVVQKERKPIVEHFNRDLEDIIWSHRGCWWVCLTSSYWEIAKEIFKLNKVPVKIANSKSNKEI